MWSWRADYQAQVFDAACWSLRICWNRQEVESGGYGRYPGEEPEDGVPLGSFRVFSRELGRLTGHDLDSLWAIALENGRPHSAD